MYMRKTLKILHTLSACGIIGGLLVYMILLFDAPQGTPEAYADLRESIAMISDYVLVPSLALVLVSGLLAMAVHHPYMNKRWAWFKAALGILMFKGVLTVVGTHADYAATVSRRITNGEAPADELATALTYEWDTLWLVMALSVVNVVLGVWRPRLERRRHAPPLRYPEKKTAAASKSAHDQPARQRRPAA